MDSISISLFIPQQFSTATASTPSIFPCTFRFKGDLLPYDMFCPVIEPFPPSKVKHIACGSIQSYYIFLTSTKVAYSNLEMNVILKTKGETGKSYDILKKYKIASLPLGKQQKIPFSMNITRSMEALLTVELKTNTMPAQIQMNVILKTKGETGKSYDILKKYKISSLPLGKQQKIPFSMNITRSMEALLTVELKTNTMPAQIRSLSFPVQFFDALMTKSRISCSQRIVLVETDIKNVSPWTISLNKISFDCCKGYSDPVDISTIPLQQQTIPTSKQSNSSRSSSSSSLLFFLIYAFSSVDPILSPDDVYTVVHRISADTALPLAPIDVGTVRIEWFGPFGVKGEKSTSFVRRHVSIASSSTSSTSRYHPDSSANASSSQPSLEMLSKPPSIEVGQIFSLRMAVINPRVKILPSLRIKPIFGSVNVAPGEYPVDLKAIAPRGSTEFELKFICLSGSGYTPVDGFVLINTELDICIYPKDIFINVI
ncbi:hypothetical protein ADUPG1_013966 [Aduncisulcus paluster]|uniref:Uncharacterized protein n=1 Tax=Aduncisulcus paluster TaxID=2918883 RepID=A0ABQ5K735_9EUKA|nr:hypothetical protein ADUPG1_013966 [Aduncisulcus paluster]